MRIYPSIWLIRIFEWLILGESLSWINIILPGYRFLNVIICFYFAFYFILKYGSRYLTWILPLLTIPFIFAFYMQTYRSPDFIIEDTANDYYLHYFYLFSIMLLGAVLAQKKKVIRSNKFDFIKLLTSIALYYGYKGILIKYELWTPQLLLPLFLIIVVYYTYKMANRIIQTRFPHHKTAQSFIFFISNLTLDIYIVQYACIKFAAGFPFPTGYLLAVTLIIISAILLNYLSKHIIHFIHSNYLKT